MPVGMDAEILKSQYFSLRSAEILKKVLFPPPGATPRRKRCMASQTGEEAAGEAARRPLSLEAETQDVAGKLKRGSDDGFAERADDASGAARPPAPAGLAYPGFVEEVSTPLTACSRLLAPSSALSERAAARCELTKEPGCAGWDVQFVVSYVPERAGA